LILNLSVFKMLIKILMTLFLVLLLTVSSAFTIIAYFDGVKCRFLDLPIA